MHSSRFFKNLSPKYLRDVGNKKANKLELIISVTPPIKKALPELQRGDCALGSEKVNRRLFA